MGSCFHSLLIVSLVFVVSSSMGHSTPCNNPSTQNDQQCCNSTTEATAAAQHPNTTSGLHTPDTKVTSTPKIWKSPGLGYTTLLRHVHGVLNIIGWGTLMPIGIMIARYFREEFPMSCDQWYSAHTVCQTCGYIMGTVGWGFGISLLNSSERSHLPFLLLGIFVILLTTIQMFAICWQPKKESGWRRRWEMYHHVMGYVIMGLIMADIFEGINAQRHPKKWRWAYVGILSVLAVVATALELYRCIKLTLFKQAMKLNANMYSHTT